MIPRPSFKARLRAWWAGCELDSTPLPEAETEEDIVVFDDSDDEPLTLSHWPQARLVAAQKVFGEGFVGPLGEEAMLEFAKPFGLTEKESVVHLGGGLGGAARALAREFSTWVDAFEADAQLTEVGTEMSVTAGLASRAKLACSDPENVDVRPGSKDALICTESLCRVADKASLTKKLAKMLKSGGQVLLVEWVAGDEAGDGTGGETGEEPPAEGWPEGDPLPVYLASTKEISKALKKAGFSISVTQDITDDYHRYVRDAFANYEESIKGRIFDERLRKWVVNEGELWTRRMAALEAGTFQVYRFFGRRV